MSNQQMHREFLLEVRQQIAEMTRNIDELRAVERFHAARANGEEHSSAEVSSETEDDFSGTDRGEITKHEAVEVVLEDSGHALKITHICDQLQAKGYSQHLTRKLLYNAIYTALKRKSGLFYELDDESGRWGLLKWRENADS